MGRRLIILSAGAGAFAALAVSASHGPSKAAAGPLPRQARGCLDWASPSGFPLPPPSRVSFALIGGTSTSRAYCIEFGRDGVCTEWAGGPPNARGYAVVGRVYRGPCGKLGLP